MPGTPAPAPLPSLSFVLDNMAKEKKLLEEIADLAELVLAKRDFRGGYQKGLSPNELLQQKLIDLRIVQAR
jgi:hypothetical protein